MLDTSKLDQRFRKLFQDGKLVQIHVSKWGMSHQLSETDLGLDQVEADKRKELPAFMLLGKKWLFTDEVRLVFSRIESSARRYLLENSHKFEIADAYFVPQRSIMKVLAALEDYQKKFNEATNSFIQNYDKHKQEMFAAYPDHRALLEPYYPSVEQLAPKFGFSVNVFEIGFPKAIKKMEMGDLIAENLAVAAAREKYERQMDEQYQQSVKQMEAFVKESALALRGQVIETFESLAAKIQNKEIVTGKNLKTVRSVIESFSALDFFDDEKVKQSLTAVKQIVDSGADFRDDQKALERLTKAVSSTLESARSLTDVTSITDNYIRRLDIGDDL